jgi:hypothetical protein
MATSVRCHVRSGFRPIDSITLFFARAHIAENLSRHALRWFLHE